MGGPMPPNRIKAWVDSLPEIDLSSTMTYAGVVVVTTEYPYYFAIAYLNSKVLELKETEDEEHLWTINDEGIIVEGPKPLRSEILSALNLPSGWSVGFARQKPNTWSYRYKLSPQE